MSILNICVSKIQLIQVNPTGITTMEDSGAAITGINKTLGHLSNRIPIGVAITGNRKIIGGTTCIRISNRQIHGKVKVDGMEMAADNQMDGKVRVDGMEMVADNQMDGKANQTDGKVRMDGIGY